MNLDAKDPHRGMPVARAGATLEEADAVVILVHGRGGSATDIISLAGVLVQGHPRAHRFAFVAPQARGHTWYPYSFLAPIPQNEPGITSGIGAVHALLEAALAAGIPRERVVIGGFSQGACLALEYAARHAARFGALLGFSGGLIGPDGTARDYPGNFEGTPAFLGCSDVDPHIPAPRVEETAAVLGGMGARVDRRFYEGMGHTINDDEVRAAQELLLGVLPPGMNS